LLFPSKPTSAYASDQPFGSGLETVVPRAFSRFDGAVFSSWYLLTDMELAPDATYSRPQISLEPVDSDPNDGNSKGAR
jgi:hypothetical protein